MRFINSVSRQGDAPEAARELAAGVEAALGERPDLVVLFVTAPLRDQAAELARELRQILGPRLFAGVTAEGVLGGDVELERVPAAALLAGTLPGVELRPFHIGMSEWRSVLEDEERLQQRVGTGEHHRGQMVLGDPFTTPVDPFLEALDALGLAPTFGGMASGAQQPGGNLLFLDDQAYRDGAIGVGLGGPVRVETVVSQGCRPVGEPMVVTRVEDALILELGRRSALEVAEETLRRLTPAELQLVQSAGLFVGVVINEYQERFGRGDFLVRGLMGVDRDSGGLAIGDFVRAGQTVQFHVRDAATAHEDLEALLAPLSGGEAPAGGLVFSCNGRGQRMFPEPHHDVRTTRTALPGLPVAGFFAMGELGPVGGKTFIHGHTASLALFRPEETRSTGPA